MDAPLSFIKLGGSLITEKSSPQTLRPGTVGLICEELAAYLQDNPGHQLVIGHGSGSFGHVPAEKYQTRAGVNTPRDWHGFWEVWNQAAQLNSIIRDKLIESGIRAICFPPSGSVTAHGGEITSWDLKPLETSLINGLVPVVYGDVVIDTELGGTILSTEDLFAFLARRLRPERILLAGLEEGVWIDFPHRTTVIPHIDPRDPASIPGDVGRAVGFDATGGMSAKVNQMVMLAKELPDISIHIFSGDDRATIRAALNGQEVGTLIRTTDR